MTPHSQKTEQKWLHSSVLALPKWIQTAGNLRNNACKHREAAKPADAANAELENNGKIRQLHPNTKILGKYRLINVRQCLFVLTNGQTDVLNNFYHRCLLVCPMVSLQKH